MAYLPGSACAQLAAQAALPYRIDSPWGLQLAPELVEHPLAPGEQAATFTDGSSATGTSNTDLALKGNADLRSGTSVVKADALHYDVDTDMADAYGHVQITHDGDVFSGPDAHLHVSETAGTMSTPAYHFTLTNGSGRASRIDLIDAQRETAYDATYTTCNCVESPAWHLRASRLDLDQGENEGVAYNGVLFFGSAPLFAFPWLAFPLNGERATGLLPPTFSLSSSSGYDFQLPVYFNLAPNYDLTLTPRVMTKRGALLTADYRYLTANSSGALSITYLPYDAITKTNRYSFSFKHQQTLGDGLAAYVNYDRVSDAAVPTDLGQNAFVLGSQTVFQEEAGVTYNHGPWSVLARVQDWQSFTTSPPYNREPEIDAKYTRYNVEGFDFGADANATRFSIPVGHSTQGARFTFDPYVSYAIVHPGWYVTPKVQWHFASYDLSSIGSNAPAGQPKTFSFNVPTLSFDSGATFERNIRLFGVDMIQTLEPRLYYVYTPYRNQTFAPIFDTAPLDFGLAEIFTSNRFVGGDRVSDMNRVTAGITTRFLDAATGAERARFVLAQEYYFRTTQVTMSGDIPPSAGPSNVIAGASFNLGDNMSVEQAVEYDQSNNAFAQATSGVSWKPADGKVLNAAYLYAKANATLGDAAVNQILLSSQWPLSRRVSAVGMIDYDMGVHRTVAGLLGMQYQADCWAVSLAFEKYTNTSSTNTPTSGTRLLMQLQLNGVSRIDNGLLQQFRASVAGYSAPAVPDAESRFTNYP
ncbi:LPS-assembly protein LptD [Paraburkholderia sp. SUR17]|uniref:LPS-assembly protein LptD n=1 Tax=Paraburkholderia sp. SUR17 TaxID=3034358 RepID=UPI0024085111|nr:LPS-assembly protein LptD [Paraburkholderia sp. SUR17]WEY41663.1 LPS-assembly protein LptD [Paraburkholderia sp. SUR17]